MNYYNEMKNIFTFSKNDDIIIIGGIYMDKINLGNMPCGQLFEFAEGSYVWKIVRTNGTREGNYLSNEPDLSICTEVFRIDNDGRLGVVWSGKLATNPGLFNEQCLDSDGCFSIFSHDQDTSSRFHQDHELEIAPMELQINALESEIEVLKNTNEMLKSHKL